MAVLTAIVTVLLGGVVSGVVTHYLASRRADRDLLRQKLELLFNAVQANRLTLVHLVHQKLPPMQGRPFTQEQQEMIDGEDDQIRSLALKGEVQPRDRVILLITLYFPQLRIAWDRIERRRKDLQDMVLQFEDTYSPTPGTVPWKHLESFYSAIDALNEEHEEFRDAVYQAITNINSMWFWLPGNRE